MKKTFLLILSIILVSPFKSEAQVSFGTPENIYKDWKFALGAEKPDFNRARTVDLPYDWSIKGQLSPNLAGNTGYLPGGVGWYQKTINIPADLSSKKVYLYFEGVYNRSEVFVNGKSVGKRPNGYVSFMYDITPEVKYGENNIIEVKVDHSQSADSRWYTGSGIYRNVYLVYANPVHIAQWGVYAYPKDVSAKGGTLKIETEVENGAGKAADVSITNELFAPDGKLAGKTTQKLRLAADRTGKIDTEIKIGNPQLWDVDNPHLYNLVTVITQNGKEIDRASTVTGFRFFAFDSDNGFALNGKNMKVKGVCIHHDAGVLGSAVPRDVWKRRLENLKVIGCNAIRTSHNPQSPEFYELCDEMGFLVMDEAFDEWEFPKRKWVEGWNVGKPGFQGAFDFFQEWGKIDLADMVRRDRNHMSVFAWSIGNEVDYPNDPYSHPVLDGSKDGFTQASFGGYKKDAPDAMKLGVIAKQLRDVVKTYDTSRPVTAGLAGVAMSNETEYPGALDIAGYNYTEARYQSDHEKYPERVIFGSENRHDFEAWKAVKNNKHIFGQFLWTGIDYLGESGRWPSRGFYSGLLDFGGFIKPRGFYRQALWSDRPMAYLGSYPAPGYGKSAGNNWSVLNADQQDADQAPSPDAWPIWNYDDGQPVRVVCYTNAAKARLKLNGKQVNEVKPYDEYSGIIHWDIAYAPGKLEVECLSADDKVVATHTLQSSKQPAAIKVIQTESSISINRGVAQIVIQIVDENGIPVMLSDYEVKCEIKGPAELLGLEAGNNADMSDYTDNAHRVFNGRMIAYVRATGKTGRVQVSFSSPWLKSANAVIEVI